MPELRTTAKEKPKLERELLAKHGIAIDETFQADDPLTDLPAHVARLKDMLLDFDKLFDGACEPILKAKHEIEAKRHGESEYPTPPDHSFVKPDADLPYFMLGSRTYIQKEELRATSLSARKFYDLEERNCSEDDWAFHLRLAVFYDFADSPYKGQDPSRYEHLLGWASATNLLWTGKINRNLDSAIVKPTQPKPDITFGFPMIEQKESISYGLAKAPLVTNFQTTVLAKVLNSSHKSSLPRLKASGNAADDLLCFPWAVVEIKPAAQSKADFCYCQAANASSYALQVFNDLVYQATNHYDHTIPLVIAFTTVGAEYRVWLAYSSPAEKQKNNHKMKCIWRHSLATTWGLIALRKIVKNMHYWATMVLRPDISSYITQCRAKSEIEHQSSSNSLRASDPRAAPKASTGTSHSAPSVGSMQTASAPPTSSEKGFFGLSFPRSSENQSNGNSNKVRSLFPNGVPRSPSALECSQPPTQIIEHRRKASEASSTLFDPAAIEAARKSLLALNFSPPTDMVGKGQTPLPVFNFSHAIKPHDGTVLESATLPTTTSLAAARGIAFIPNVGQPERRKSSSSLQPFSFGLEPETAARPRSSSSLAFDAKRVKDLHARSKSVTGASASVHGTLTGRGENRALSDANKYHVYQLDDHNNRWQNNIWGTFNQLLPYVPSEREQEHESGSGSIKQPGRDSSSTNDDGGPVTSETIQNWGKQALLLLTGKQLLRLRSIKECINSKSNEAVINLVIRILQYLGSSYHGKLDDVEPVLHELNHFLGRRGDHKVWYTDLKDVNVLGEMQIEMHRLRTSSDPTDDDLRILLRRALATLQSEPFFDLMGLNSGVFRSVFAEEKIAEMRRQAVLIMLQEWSGESLEDGNSATSEWTDESDEWSDDDDEWLGEAKQQTDDVARWMSGAEAHDGILSDHGARVNNVDGMKCEEGANLEKEIHDEEGVNSQEEEEMGSEKALDGEDKPESGERVDSEQELESQGEAQSEEEIGDEEEVQIGEETDAVEEVQSGDELDDEEGSGSEEETGSEAELDDEEEADGESELASSRDMDGNETSVDAEATDEESNERRRASRK